MGYVYMKIKFKINETLMASIVFFIILIILIIWNKPTSSSFRCPNDYLTAKEYIYGVAQWLSEESKKTPKITQDELLNKREKLFYKYNCERSRWLGKLVD